MIHDLGVCLQLNTFSSPLNKDNPFAFGENRVGESA